MTRERDSARIRDRLRTRAKGDLAYRPNAGSEAALEQRRGRANLVLFNEAWMHHGDVALEEWVDGGYPNGFLERIEEIWSEGGLRLAGELAHAVRVEVAREIRGA